MSMATLPDAEIYTSCRQIIELSAHLTDSRQFDAYAALFTETGQLTRPGGEPLVGRAAIIDSYRNRPADRLTRHMIGQCVMTLVHEGRVSATTTVLLWSAPATLPVETFGRKAEPREVLGQYCDELVLTPEGWRIEKRTSSFLMYRESHRDE